MRDIKFRGMRVGNKEWIYGYYCKDQIVDGIIPFDKTLMGFRQVIPETVGQFTGLLDKNSKEIYEGTISQTIAQDGTKLSKFVYFYNEGLGRFQKRRDDGQVFDCDKISEGGKVIIGNITETPELLEE